jgi:metal-responsive CopG/Arc/MetJ family transcriptional regulator
MTERISLTLPDGIVDSLDKKRGDVSRSRFILRLLEKTLGVDKE